MSIDDLHAEQIEAQLRQVRLCSLVIEDVLESLADPVSAESRADLLLAAERLAVDVVRLVDETRAMAWNQPSSNISPDTFL